MHIKQHLNEAEGCGIYHPMPVLSVTVPEDLSRLCNLTLQLKLDITQVPTNLGYSEDYKY